MMDKISTINANRSEAGSTVRLWKSKVKPLLAATTSIASERILHQRSNTLRSTQPHIAKRNSSTHLHRRTLTGTLSHGAHQSFERQPSRKPEIALSNLYKTEAYADAARRSGLKWPSRVYSSPIGAANMGRSNQNMTSATYTLEVRKGQTTVPSWLPPGHKTILNTYEKGWQDCDQTTGKSTPKLGSPNTCEAMTQSPVTTETTAATTTTSMITDEATEDHFVPAAFESSLPALNRDSAGGGGSWGEVMLRVLFEESEKSPGGETLPPICALNADIPRILLCQWLGDDELRGETSEALVSIQLVESLRGLRCLTNMKIDFSSSEDAFPCGCSGGSIWRMRVDSNQSGGACERGWMRRLKEWVEGPSEPPVYRNRVSSWDIETLRFQYAGELNPCRLEMCSGDCPKRLIGGFLSVEEWGGDDDPSILEAAKTGWKAAMRPDDYLPVPLKKKRLGLQKLSPSFRSERSIFAVYARDRRRGKCHLFHRKSGCYLSVCNDTLPAFVRLLSSSTNNWNSMVFINRLANTTTAAKRFYAIQNNQQKKKNNNLLLINSPCPVFPPPYMAYLFQEETPLPQNDTASTPKTDDDDQPFQYLTADQSNQSPNNNQTCHRSHHIPKLTLLLTVDNKNKADDQLDDRSDYFYDDDDHHQQDEDDEEVGWEGSTGGGFNPVSISQPTFRI